MIWFHKILKLIFKAAIIEENYLPNLTAFLDIYLYLKSKNNDDSVKHVLKVKLLNLLFIYFSLCIFAKLLMSFLKAQVTFPLNFSSIFSAIRNNSSVLFLAQT